MGGHLTVPGDISGCHSVGSVVRMHLVGKSHQHLVGKSQDFSAFYSAQDSPATQNGSVQL